MTDSNTPRPTDDLETAARKSKSVDERVPDRQDRDAGPSLQLPGSVGINMPHAGVVETGPRGSGDLGPGEAALDRERAAQETPTRHG